MSNIIVNSTEQLFGRFNIEGDLSNMTDNEKKLINIIREQDNPERTVDFAINLLIDFLAKREVPQDTSSAHPRVSA